MDVKFPYKKLVYFLCICLHGHLARLIIWIYGLYTGGICSLLARNLVLSNRDVTFYLEVFLESMPQMYLQLYTMIVIYGTYTTIGIVTLVFSFLSVSWGILLLFDSNTSKLFAFEVNLLWTVSRVLALSVFSSIRRMALFLLLGTHFVVMLPLWFYETKRNPFRNQNRHGFLLTLVSDILYSILYAVCNTVTPIVSRYHFLLSIIFCVENLCCCISVYYFGELRRNIQTRDIYDVIKFKDWQYGAFFMSMCCVLTLLAFLQSAALFGLRYGQQVAPDFMRSNILRLVESLRANQQRRVSSISNTITSTITSTS